MKTVVEVVGVRGRPKILMDLPSPMRIGDRVRVRFCLQRRKDGRTFVLVLDDEVRVTGVSFDATRGAVKQALAVECLGTPPTWKAVRNAPSRALPPAKLPPTSI